VALVVVVGTVLALIPATTGTAKIAPKPKTVEIVGPDGTPLKVVNGNLAIVPGRPAGPLHFLASANLNAGGSMIFNVATGVPAASTISISSVTLTCLTCSAANNANVNLELLGFSAPDCSSGHTDPVVFLDANASEPSVDYTFPTPRATPTTFTPTGPWCLQATLSVPSGTANAAFTVDGSQT